MSISVSDKVPFIALIESLNSWDHTKTAMQNVAGKVIIPPNYTFPVSHNFEA